MGNRKRTSRTRAAASAKRQEQPRRAGESQPVRQVALNERAAHGVRHATAMTWSPTDRYRNDRPPEPGRDRGASRTPARHPASERLIRLAPGSRLARASTDIVIAPMARHSISRPTGPPLSALFRSVLRRWFRDRLASWIRGRVAGTRSAGPGGLVRGGQRSSCWAPWENPDWHGPAGGATHTSDSEPGLAYRHQQHL